ncbi:WD40-repeat-containing domain protein [Phlyctochytrium arcticum]|nr:WD40-repeat-containing domain protein [Phlyctochytrium arcticum]
MSRLRLGLSIHQALTSREIFQNAQTRLFQPSLRNYAKNFVSTENDMYQVKTEYGGISPPFTCAYANTTYGGKCLAVADEDGTIGLLDTRHGAAHELEVPRTKWTAHNNAVFDICWAANDQQLMSAAGDQTARVWDVETQKCLSVFSGHNCSIKSVASNGRNPFVFATAARDGKIMTWDTRCNGITVRDVDSHRATDTIKNAHQNICAAPSKDRSKKRSRRQLSAQSVTCVRYWTNNETMLISSGSADGLLKIWDLRNHSTHFRKEFPTPFATSTLAAGKRRSHGISSFAVDSRGCRVYATCTAGIVSEYDLNNLQCPIRSFSATTFRVSSFYVKTTISPDDQFVATGSSDSGLYIWDTKCHPLRQDKPPLILRSHLSEVTGVSWSKTDLEELGSCSDDSTIRVWQIKPDYVEKDQDSRFESLRGHVEEGELREIRGQGN